MKTLDLTQGTQEWLDARLLLRTASEAPAMMGDSKYFTRNQLLDHKRGWTNIINEFRLKLYQEGHEAEARARPIAERILDEDLSPLCGQLEDTNYMSSYDGITMFGDIAWEHKLWNKVLAENVKNGVLEPHYYWQLEHQLLVSGADKVMFMVSDGTEENMEYMFYESVPERRESLIAGWKQFDIDFETHEIEAKTEKVLPATVSLPDINYDVYPEMDCLVVKSNIKEYKTAALALVEIAKKKPESDQEYANAAELVKALKQSEDRLSEARVKIKSRSSNIDQITDDIDFIISQFKEARLAADRFVKNRKEEIKQSLILPAEEEIKQLISEAGKKYGSEVTVHYDFKKATKNKRNIDNLKAAIAQELANAKIALNEKIEELKTIEHSPAESRLNEARQIVEEIQSGPSTVTQMKPRPEETVTIPKAEYDHLIERDALLTALEAAGVDNWDGWNNAIEMLQAS
ncbi:YqaJ viral recombinase family protein [Vibrio quintilis]|uniref:YqaJ-like viral recombinase domain protein n=1 Tax=Vibrio quintilis TaxID=1117707 RepID=A0A1M7YP03_9VIBR|nr:YqaJ viral recombinase family protein [Vibrio quintilis]SHO54374.1 YqaJ-like viral recombinase domain protein [Vibrio quintilis]